MAQYAVIGAGATGSATARRLAETGDEVRIVTRRGHGPEHPRVERIALDAGDTDALSDAVAGVRAVINCAATPYHTWPEAMPAFYGSILTAAERTGADYVMLGNLYGYSETDRPITERTPMEPTTRKGRTRAALWRTALAAHEAGRVRATEIRAGQFLGPGAYSAFALLVERNVLEGRLALLHGDPDVAHSFSYIEDVAAALIAVSKSDTAWGRAWNAPVITATVREAARRFAELSGAPEPRLASLTERDLTLLGFADPTWTEFIEMTYMVDRPFIVDDAAIRETFGLKAATLDEALTR
jgi:nucleoside-diphosphate-sugar epimerase